MTSDNALASGVEDIRRRLLTVDEFQRVWRESSEQQRLDFWVTLHLIADNGFTHAEPSGAVWYSADGGHCDTCTCAPVWIEECPNCGSTITAHRREPPRWCSPQCRTEWRSKNRPEYRYGNV